MKVALFSDLHLHPFKDFSTLLPNGRNSRLQNGLDVMRKIREYCVEHKIRTVLFGGDLFHQKHVLPVGLYQAAYREISKFKRDGIEGIFVVGNHDQSSADGSVHAITALSSVVHVVSKPEMVLLSAKTHETVWCVPYMEDHKEFKRALKNHATLLLAHGAINGAVTGPVEFQPEHPLRIKDVPTSYGFRFFGHYHKRQKMAEQCWYIGSPLQHVRGEMNEHDKGFLVYDTETKKCTNVPLGFPEFRSYASNQIERLEKVAVKGNFVDVEVDSDKSNPEEVKQRFLDLGAVAVNVVPVTRVKVKKSRLKVSPTMSPSSMVDKYVSEYGKDVDGDEVKKLAHRYLSGVL